MGHIGVSITGIAFLAMLLIPNALWTRARPQGYSAVGENPTLVWCERIGQVASTACLVGFRDYDPTGVGPWLAWYAAAVALMIAYALYWVRYFRGEHTLRNFYGRFGGVPVPGASLPVAAMLGLAAYGRVVWLAAAGVVLGVGHIGIHARHAREAGCL